MVTSSLNRLSLHMHVAGSSGTIATDPVFNPTTLFGGGDDGGWYDVSDKTTNFQDTAGTIPVVADGDPWNRVNDKSGKGRHLIANAGSGVWHLAGSIAYASIPSGVYLTEATGTLIVSGTMYMGVTAQPTDAATGGMIGVINSSIDRFLINRIGGTSLNSNYAAAGNTYNQTYVTSNNVALYADSNAVFSTTVSTDLFVNGFAGTVSVNTSPIVSGLAGKITLNAINSLGGSASTYNFGAGIVINRNLTVPERASCTTFFGSKAGLVL